MNKRVFSISAGIFCLTIVLLLIIGGRGNPDVVEKNLYTLPMNVDGYRATDDTYPDYITEGLQTDEYVYRHYVDARGDRIDLYIGYYGTAKGGRTGHNPLNCLPGSGWSIISVKKIPLEIGAGSATEVNYVLAIKNDAYVTMLHWYQSNKSKVFTTGVQRNIDRFFSRLFRNRNDGAYVQVSLYTPKDQTHEALNLAKSFAQKIISLLPSSWPKEGSST